MTNEEKIEEVKKRIENKFVTIKLEGDNILCFNIKIFGKNRGCKLLLNGSECVEDLCKYIFIAFNDYIFLMNNDDFIKEEKKLEKELENKLENKTMAERANLLNKLKNKYKYNSFCKLFGFGSSYDELFRNDYEKASQVSFLIRNLKIKFTK